MAKYHFEDGTEMDIDIEKLRYEHEIGKINAKKEADLEIEDRKAQHALALEEKRLENNLTVENRKGLWALGGAILGVAAGIGLTIWANNRGISQRDINDGANKRRLFKP